MDEKPLSGKTVVITGANAGLGKATAVEIAKAGARVILACRSKERADVARDDIVGESGNDNVVVMILDLASLNSIRRFAEKFNKDESRLDILINNAGLGTKDRQVTEDGFECTFQVNHLGHFLLTNLLLDKIKASSPSRIVNLSSSAHGHGGKVDMGDLNLERGWSMMKAYARSKTMNVLFTVELAKRLKDSGVTTYAVHPGVVKTNFQQNLGGMFQNKCFTSCLFPCLLGLSCNRWLEATEGATTTLYCAMSADVREQTGLYYVNSKVSVAKSHATDPLTALQLWDKSAALCGLDVA